MTSSNAGVRKNAPRIPNEDWEKWKDFIRTHFLLLDQDMATIVGALRNGGLEVTKSQLETRLKKWGYRKNGGRTVWRFADNKIRKRKEAGKQSLVILSGRRLAPEEVDAKVKRSMAVTWMPDSHLQPAEPEPQSPGDDLPICHRDGVPSLWKSKKRPKTIVWTLMAQLVGRTLRTMLGSERISMSLAVTRSVDRLAAGFDSVLPESYPGENLQRSAVIAGGSHSER
ncbi:hypothetical protein GQ53DRAFT_809758 [Thozetella sp. PMI_491]|nr:hypothetical protein GQ53DRAFT_809758 [Thozetella sp. PMI_491]